MINFISRPSQFDFWSETLDLQLALDLELNLENNHRHWHTDRRAAKSPCGGARVTFYLISGFLAARLRAGPHGRWPCPAQSPVGDSIGLFWPEGARPRPR